MRAERQDCTISQESLLIETHDTSTEAMKKLRKEYNVKSQSKN